MVEPTPGLYVGTLSARVREEAWSVVTASIGAGAAVLLHPAPTEQGFTLHTAGERRRIPQDFDGLTSLPSALTKTEGRRRIPSETGKSVGTHGVVWSWIPVTGGAVPRSSESLRQCDQTQRPLRCRLMPHANTPTPTTPRPPERCRCIQ
ncbi:type I-E CRISPR-associated endoribonuclease Cas2e [Streptomyces anulatus]